jgi:hypothetical protein
MVEILQEERREEESIESKTIEVEDNLRYRTHVGDVRFHARNARLI